MAEWDPATSYSQGTTVTYKGLTYLRSPFPPTPTSGVNPKEEMSVDPKGDPIRTWELRLEPLSLMNYAYYPYHIGYFSLQAPERSDGIYTKEPPLANYPGKLNPENPYAGPSNQQIGAYGYVTQLNTQQELLGYSVEMDQARAAVPPGTDPPTPGLPYAPAMPADKCGVAMQQFKETFSPDPPPQEPWLTANESYASTGVSVYLNLTYDSTTKTWYQDSSARPRIFYVFLMYNHPLYFRRQHTITFRISTFTYTGGYTIPMPPPGPDIIVPGTSEGIYSSSTQGVTGTDTNYCSYNTLTGDYFQPANAITTYTLPNDVTTPGPYGSTDGTNYELVEVFVSNVDSND